MEERKEKPEKTCYICSSNKFVDDHHYDCREGTISPETVPLCRRCHRTYHMYRGIHMFEDEYLDKAIEIENKRREIRGEPPFRREDIERSDYWNKTHGITKRKERKPEPVEQLYLPFVVSEGKIGRFNEPELL